MGFSNLHRILPRTNILLKTSPLIMVVEAVGTTSHILIKVLPCKATPQTSPLTIKTNRPVTIQISRIHNLAFRTALTAEVMAVTAATTSMVPTDACQALAQILRLAGLVDEGVVLRLHNFQTCHGRQHPALEAAAPPLKHHVRSRLSHPKPLLILHLSTPTIIHFAHPKTCA